MASVISREKLLEMELHQEMGLGNDGHSSNSIMRVDGGWIYWRKALAKSELKDGETESKPVAIAGVFVPENAFVRA